MIEPARKKRGSVCVLLALACAVGLACLMQPATAWGQSITGPVRLNQRSIRCANPCVAMGPSGGAIAVWDGYDEKGARHVWVSDQDAAGRWGPELKLSAGMPGASFEPAVAVDPKGYPHVVWSSRDGSTSHIYYSRRRGNVVLPGAPADAAEWSLPEKLDLTVSRNCELPSIAFDDAGRPFVLWQEGLGMQYRIFAAWAPYKGKWRVEPLCPSQETGDCFDPQLVTGRRLMAVWYQSDDAGLTLQAAIAPGGPDEQWTMTRLTALDGLPADRLPSIHRDGQGRLWALWTDTKGGVLERALMAPGQESAGLGATLQVDDQPDATNRHPVVNGGPAKSFALSWIVEKDGDRRIAIRLLSPEAVPANPSVMISDPSDTHVDSPSLCLAPDGRAHTAWDSDFSGGGTGDVFYACVAF